MPSLERSIACTRRPASGPSSKSCSRARLDHTPAAAAQIGLAYRRADLFAHRLGDASRAVNLLEDLIGRARGHADARELLEELLHAPSATPETTMRIARLLEPLYEQDKLWKDLVGVLRVQRTLVAGPEAVELLARIASIEEVELGGAGNAFDAWVEVLRLDPTHERARVELSRLAPWLSRWPEAIAALEAAAAATPASDAATRTALLGNLAMYYDTQTGDSPRAIAAYQRLLDADPTNPNTIRRAGSALARLYEEARAWPELRAVTRKQAEWADPSQRRALLARVAALKDEQADRAAAIATWRDVLADEPADAGALHALERLYQATEPLARSDRCPAPQGRRRMDARGPKCRTPGSRRRARLDADDGGQNPKALLARIAEIHEVMLEEPDEAIAAFLEVPRFSATGSAARPRRCARAHRARALVSRRRQRHADCSRCSSAKLADARRRATARGSSWRSRSRSCSRGRSVDSIDALELCWANRARERADGDPAGLAALAALEAALDDLDICPRWPPILLDPHYAATGQHGRLAALQLRLADWSDDPGAKLRALGEVVRIREHRLGDPAGAFEAQLRALRVAASEPELAHAVSETERLAGELGAKAI